MSLWEPKVKDIFPVTAILDLFNSVHIITHCCHIAGEAFPLQVWTGTRLC